jgi:hypothetical protein
MVSIPFPANFADSAGVQGVFRVNGRAKTAPETMSAHARGVARTAAKHSGIWVCAQVYDARRAVKDLANEIDVAAHSQVGSTRVTDGDVVACSFRRGVLE